jgi:hypothetical protein
MRLRKRRLMLKRMYKRALKVQNGKYDLEIE